MSRKRADVLLVEKGLAPSREKARALINAGQVYLPNGRVEKPSQLLEEDQKFIIKEGLKYVSRAGYKLEKALDDFEVDPSGRVCLDIGASTGGFTDCLIQRGASRVYAVDVDPRQLHYKLRQLKNVFPIKLNARYIGKDHLPELPDIVTIDVSFISALKILEPLSRFLPEETLLLVLVKPQFEAGRDKVGKGGIVRDRSVIIEVVSNFCIRATEMGFYPHKISLPIKGKEGNQEVFVLFKRVPSSLNINKILEELI